MTTMNREELSTMTKAQLAELTAFTGNLKNIRKDELIDRALELMSTVAENTENKEENIMTTTTEPKVEKKERKKVMFTDAVKAAIDTAIADLEFDTIITDKKYIVSTGKRRLFEVYPIKGDRFALYVHDNWAKDVEEMLKDAEDVHVYVPKYSMKHHWDLSEERFIQFISTQLFA